MLEVSPAAIKKWIQQGKLAAFRTGRTFPDPRGRVRAVPEDPWLRDALRVLVVDDQRDVGDVIVASLRAFHPRARIETAANGFEGLLKVGTFRPDVLLLDLSMPGMDGFEVCRQIKRDPVIRDTKVIVMTARLLDAEPRAMDAGADGFLSKPFEAATVHGLLARLLARR